MDRIEQYPDVNVKDRLLFSHKNANKLKFLFFNVHSCQTLNSPLMTNKSAALGLA